MFRPDFSVFSDPERRLRPRAEKRRRADVLLPVDRSGRHDHLRLLPRQAGAPAAQRALSSAARTRSSRVMAGMAVMPACSAFGVEYGAGPGLLFASMQTVFSHMGSVGNLIGFLFYLLVLIAALTSSISMLELCTAYAVDKQIDKGLTPKRAKHTSERRGARVHRGFARRARRSGCGRCRRRRRRDAGHPARSERARLERLLARPVRHGRRGHPHAARCARDDDPHRLGAQARGRADRMRAERL